MVLNSDGVLVHLDGDPTNNDIGNLIIAPREMFEARTFHCPCGAELVVDFPETCNWDDFESEKLADAKWELRGDRYLCSDCSKPTED